MPELPEVETVARGLERVWLDRTLTAVTTRRAGLRRPFPTNFALRLTGRRFVSVGRRAKYLLAHFDDGLVLLGHLGMSGRMVISGLRNTPPGPHDHVEFVTDDGTLVTMTDPRRFGLLDLSTETELAAHPLLAGLGPEPLEDSFDAAVLGAALAGKATAIKLALLDQTVVAGLGNIYVCESLFRAGLSPLRPAGSVSGAELTALVSAIKAVLHEAIAAGGSSLRDHVRPDGELGYFQHGFKVYGRAGQPCPDCAGPPGCPGIERIVQGGRSTFHCARRQR
ncbi:bifunctional DNA-formamidopyrimidine glycosylase/DNA-(apurinic or apyrimidinic site) lyase [Magnetospirillum molischianum]|uniref:Formamidopyrimidine-DNA glycosylase n=1 Tax=Magnetospirillum molischianum DSM 120 TaxID=1150626 RepID=H8FU63_MAGML|nr:bifunctional DNA-formamidopyrimidine glycosylase/DNA-(apurinic or apyrimidinic site) lyase [Magnetospirillum molischianum]CCG41901.1 Bifunctional mutM protein:Formamidopyrimidine-DNA glycosylase (Fapy-DNA glycosylase); (DNA-(apurinic or apyrimidinic site) lyase mutM) (AP lyase mutM) [Magnetospirillum molischianum DSM 120]